jgi:transposase
MPAERISMRKIREVLRLKYECQFSTRQISESCRVGKTSVIRYLERAAAAGLAWPLPAELTDDALEQALYQRAACVVASTPHPHPDWSVVHQEMKRKAVTMFLLWEEYRTREPQGLSYSRFCFHYREFKKTLDPVMRQTHKAGEKLFVDYAGMTIPWIDPVTYEVFEAQIFVAVLGASNYTFVEATRSQSLPDWIGSHVRAFQFFGGVPDIVVPDNLKSGVTSPHRYDPDTNPTYQDMANHYGVAVIPARIASPQDKAKVEVGVQGIERRILAKLRDRTFSSLAEINEAIQTLLMEYNAAAFKQMPGSRRSEFEGIDKPALKALPVYPYEYAEWKKARAGVDYHVAVDHHYYSVPFRYLKHELDVKITRSLITCFYKGKIIATHARIYRKGHTTIKEHMPKHHREYAEWTPERLIHWASQAGEATGKLVTAMIEARAHPQQAYRACLGVMRLGKHYGTQRLEKAAARALAIGALSYQSMESILKQGLDQKPIPSSSLVSLPAPNLTHDNLRGRDYYH